jgi:hypothetical protein
MKLKFIFGLLGVWMLGLSSTLQAQFGSCGYDWTKGWASANLNTGIATAVDPFGNSYVTGSFTGTLTLGTTTLTSAGEADIVVAKFDPTGAVLWAKRFGGTGSDEGYGIAINPSGAPVITGNFNGRAAFGTFFLLARGESDIFLTQLNTEGGVIWAKRAGGRQLDFAREIAVDRSGNILVTGSFTDTANFTGTALTLPGLGALDVFIAKYNSRGEIQWARRAGSALTDDEGFGITSDEAGNVYVTGSFQGVADFEGRPLSGFGGLDIFLAAYDPSGSLLWINAAGSPLDDVGISVAATRAGHLYVGGQIGDAATFGDSSAISFGESDAFVARYQTTGIVDWVRAYGGPGLDFLNRLAVDTASNVYITGGFSSTILFDVITQISAGETDAYVAKISPDGQVFWAYPGGGAGVDNGSGVAVGPDNTVYYSGSFAGQGSFGDDTLRAPGQNSNAFHSRVCNFVKRNCTFNYQVRATNVTAAGLDGTITVSSLSGGRAPYLYSVDDEIYQFDSVITNLDADTFCVFIMDETGCTASECGIIIIDICKASPLQAEIVGLANQYCIANNATPIDLELDTQEPLRIIGWQGRGVVGSQLFLDQLQPGDTSVVTVTVERPNRCRFVLRDTVGLLNQLAGSITGLPDSTCATSNIPIAMKALPEGGEFLRPLDAITGSSFIPINARTSGPVTIIYQADSAGCTYLAERTIVLVGESADIRNLEPRYCVDGQVVNIDPTPPGGTLISTTPGALSGLVFNPSVAGIGVHQIFYFGFDPASGCSYTVSKTVIVERAITAQLPRDTSLCVSSAREYVLDAIPSNGDFTGPGVIFNAGNYVFIPSTAGIGTHVINYSGVLRGCPYQGSFRIQVTAGPSASISGLRPRYCLTDNDVYEAVTAPRGGSFSTNPPSALFLGNSLNPAGGALGTFQIIYQGIDSIGCQFRTTSSVEITNISASLQGLSAKYCATSDSVVLTATPSGGTFSGEGVEGNFFRPILAGPAGVKLITYSGDSSGCFFEVQQSTTTFAPLPTFITNLDSAYCLNATTSINLVGAPAGGAFSGPGVIGNRWQPIETGQVGQVIVEYKGNDGTCDFRIADTTLIVAGTKANIANVAQDYCITDNRNITPTGTPSGGLFLVNNRLATNFNPSRLGPGSIQITYFGDSAGCPFNFTRTAFVNIVAPAQIVGLVSEFCSLDSMPVNLVGTPAGGTFFGPGVVNNVFVPSRSSFGNIDISYRGSFKGCRYDITQPIFVERVCCPVPVLDTVLMVRATSAQPKWFATNGSFGYQLSFRLLGSTVWSAPIFSESSLLNITNLQACSGYEYRVRSMCVNGRQSDWSPSDTFFTPPATRCLPPNALRVSRTTATTATVVWRPVGGCFTEFEVRYRFEDDDLERWVTVRTSDTSVVLTGLSSDTLYTLQVRTRCGEATYSVWSRNLSFRTQRPSPQFCPQPTEFMLNRLTIHRAEITWLAVGGAAYYDLEWRMGNTGNWFRVREYESIFTIDSLIADTTYEVRIKTICTLGGESEFTDSIVFRSAQNCTVPQDVRLSFVDDFFAGIDWSPVRRAEDYEVRYQAVNSTQVSSGTVIDPNILLNNLQGETLYTVEVRARCGLTTSAFSDPFVFATLEGCRTPRLVNINPGTITPTSATLEWRPVRKAQSYQICWIPTDSSTRCTTFTLVEPGVSELTNANLTPNTFYTVTIRTLCPDGLSAPTTVQFLTAPDPNNRLSAAQLAGQLSGVSIYPNPNKGQFSVRYAAQESANVVLTLHDLSGQQVWRQETAVEAGHGQLPVTIESLASGVYLLTVQSGQHTHHLKMVRE